MAFVRPGVFPAPRDAAYPASLDYVKQPARTPPHSVQSYTRRVLRRASWSACLWCVFRRGEASDSFQLVGQDGTEQGMIWSHSQVRERDDEDLFGTLVWRHVTHDPALVSGVEHALD